jgi:hypothetical protein
MGKTLGICVLYIRKFTLDSNLLASLSGVPSVAKKSVKSVKSVLIREDMKKGHP